MYIFLISLMLIKLVLRKHTYIHISQIIIQVKSKTVGILWKTRDGKLHTIYFHPFSSTVPKIVQNNL